MSGSEDWDDVCDRVPRLPVTKRSRVFPHVLAVVAVAVLSACTSRVGGVPVAGATVPLDPAELTAESVFDDLTTVNPCSLTKPSVFDALGSADFGAPQSLDYCTINVKPTVGGEATVNVGTFGELATTPELSGKRVKDIERGLWVGQHDDDPAQCIQLLVFPDDMTMEVWAYSVAGDVDTCPIVEAGMNYAIEVILNADVSHRSPDRDSLALVDPCSLIDDQEVIAIPGLAGVRKPENYPGKHRCYWSAGDAASVVVEFGVSGPKQVAGETHGLVAGRPTVTIPVELDARSYCTVETAHLPFTEMDGFDDILELAGVWVRMPQGQVTAACTAARAVAELVWPQLPSA